MGERGRQRVLAEFTADRMASRAVQLYREVMSEPVGGLPVGARISASVPTATRGGRSVIETARPVHEALAAIVRGDSVALPVAGDAVAEFLEAATHHGLNALVAERLGRDRLHHAPAVVRAALGRELALGAALEALRQRELKEVLDLLASRGVSPLLLKGSALAYTHYGNPEHRPRFDTDLLVGRDDMDAVAEVMARRGYVRPNQVTGELVMHQLDYARKDAQGLWHVYDFHWKLANRQAVADMLSHDELAREAVAVESLGPHARGLGSVHALMLACVHRVAHHASNERLIWIYDIHVLTEALSPAEVAAFAALAVDRSVSAICADGLAAAHRWFRTRGTDGSCRTAHPRRPTPPKRLRRF